MYDVSGHIFRSPTLYPAELRARRSMIWVLDTTMKTILQWFDFIS